MLIGVRVQFPPGFEANTPYGGIPQEKRDVLLASCVKLCVFPILHEKANTDYARFAPPKPLRSRPRSVRMEAGGQPDMILT